MSDHTQHPDPADHADHAELDALLKRLCEDALDDAGFARLDALLTDNPEAQARYVDVMTTHQMLGSMMRAASGPIPLEAATVIQDAAEDPTIQRAHGDRRRGTVFRYAAAAALLLVAGVAVALLWSDNAADIDTAPPVITAQTPADQPVATLTDTRDARWEPDAGHDLLDLGAPVEPGRLRLRSGAAELLMQSTATVTLMGPADVQMLGPNRCRLNRGRLVANVPEMAHGFTVETPTHTVVDLGTRFGVEVDETGDTHVSVFDGRVDVRPHGGSAAAAHTLVAGRALRIDAATAQHNPTAVATYRFVTPQSSGVGVEHATPAAVFIDARADADTHADHIPQALPEHDAHLVVVLESQRIHRPRHIDATLAAPGDLDRYDRGRSATLPGDTPVRSYLVRFDPFGAPLTHRWVDAELRFEAPILAVIASGDHLRQSHDAFASARVAYRELDGLEGAEGAATMTQRQKPDRVTVDADRRTLRLHLGVINDKVDHIRVITEAPADVAGR